MADEKLPVERKVARGEEGDGGEEDNGGEEGGDGEEEGVGGEAEVVV